MERKYVGQLFVTEQGQFVTFEERGRTRTVPFRAKPRLEANIIERHRQHLMNPRRVRFFGHVEFDPQGERDDSAIMFIVFLRFLDPPPADLLAAMESMEEPEEDHE